MKKSTFVIFIDLKEFTYKNSLLTDLQLEDILYCFDQVVRDKAEKTNTQVLKNIGDAYLCICEDAKDLLSFIDQVIFESSEYDKKQVIDLKKMSLHMAVTYGEITKNKVSLNDDYFGDAINLASRIVSITPKGHIFCDDKSQKILSQYRGLSSIGDQDFHGIIGKTGVYSITNITQKEIYNLSHDMKSLFKECDEIVFRCSCVSAILTLQPIPVLESLNIIAVHLYMITRLGAKFDQKVTLENSGKIFMKMVTPLGLSFVGLQGMNTLAKIILPGIGGIIFAPLSFAVTYALGKIYTVYFMYDASGQHFPHSSIKMLFSRQKDNGYKIAKSQRKTIYETGKKFYSDVMSIHKRKNFTQVQKDITIMLRK